MIDRARIAIVDDHPLFREGVAFALTNEPDLEVVGQGASIGDAIVIMREKQPDLLLLDLDMPGNTLLSLHMLQELSPKTRIAILTASDDEDNVAEAFRNGARGYILKEIMSRELARIIRSILSGQGYVPPSLAAGLISQLTSPPRQTITPPRLINTLTERERQILEHVGEGWSNKEIAQRLILTEKTVKHYMTVIFQKLQVRNRVEAALLIQSERVNKG
jgi:two-component system, NarL family, nitrate/nitrite response regulator NarL